MRNVCLLSLVKDSNYFQYLLFISSAVLSTICSLSKRILPVVNFRNFTYLFS